MKRKPTLDISDILTRPEIQERMKTVSHQGKPAIEAIMIELQDEGLTHYGQAGKQVAAQMRQMGYNNKDKRVATITLPAEFTGKAPGRGAVFSKS